MQVSVNSFRLEAATALTNSISLFSKLKQNSVEVTPKKFLESVSYRQGKSAIAARMQQKHDKEEIALVKSLVYVHSKAPRLFLRTRDLTHRTTSQLLALNRRKFGESSLSSLRVREEKSCRPRASVGDLDESLKQEQTRKMKRSFEQSPVKSPPKSRTAMAREQERLFEESEQMSPLNKLVFDRSLKYKGPFSRKLIFKHDKRAMS
jgi:hypothetical protein